MAQSSSKDNKNEIINRRAKISDKRLQKDSYTIGQKSHYQRVMNLAKMMQRVLSPTKGVFNRQRFKSPQYQLDNFIKLPSFDRGRRKISKMGGIQVNYYSGVKQKPVAMSPNLKSRKDKTRRLTSTSPNPSNKLANQFVKMNTLNLTHNKNNDNSQERRGEPRHLFEVIPEVNNRKKLAIGDKITSIPQKLMAKISQKKKSQKSRDSSRIMKQNTLKARGVK